MYIPIPNGTIVSALLITNYAKTPSRGAKLVDIQLDDALIFQGYLRQYSPETPRQSILFSNDSELVAKYRSLLFRGVP